MSELVSAFYDRFLLRDVFGKAVPGATFLLALAAEGQWGEIAAALSQVTSFDLPTQLLLLGLAWVAGVGIQEAGHRFLSLLPGSLFGGLWPDQYDDDDRRRRYTLRRWVLLGISDEPERKRRVDAAERLVVMKEAANNEGMALLLSLAPAVLFPATSRGTEALDCWLLGVLAGVGLGLVWVGSRFKARQFDYWELLAEEAGWSGQLGELDHQDGRSELSSPS